jgi:hypothetical protein
MNMCCRLLKKSKTTSATLYSSLYDLLTTIDLDVNQDYNRNVIEDARQLLIDRWSAVTEAYAEAKVAMLAP